MSELWYQGPDPVDVPGGHEWNRRRNIAWVDAESDASSRPAARGHDSLDLSQLPRNAERSRDECREERQVSALRGGNDDSCEHASGVAFLRKELAWASIADIQVHRCIPVDKRHNAKIDYPALYKLVAHEKLSSAIERRRRCSISNCNAA